MILFFLWGCTTPCSSTWEHGEVSTVEIDNENWIQTALTDGICGSAFITSANIDSDPYPEVLISNFNRPDGFALSTGHLTAYSLEDDISYTQPISEEMNYKWPNDVVTKDMDSDGDVDLLIGFGFLTCLLNPWTTPCGALTWFENDNGNWKPHDIVPQGDDLFYHKALVLDLNDDGIDDVVATAEGYFTPFGGQDEALLYYWLGTGGGNFSKEPQLLSEGFGSLLQLVDVDGDGDDDIVSSEYFHPTPKSAVWLEQIDSTSVIEENWKKHVIDDTSGPSIQFEIVSENNGFYGILSNHTNTEKANPDTIPSGLYLLEPSEDPTELWNKKVIYEEFVSDAAATQAAPGIFSLGDIDGDSDLDILISGDGDPRVFLFKKDGEEYTKHLIFDNMPQAGVHVVDVNNDGQLEMFIGSYEENVVFFLQKEL